MHLGIREVYPVTELEKEITSIKIRLIKRIHSASIRKKKDSSIAVINPQTLSQLYNMEKKYLWKKLDDIFNKGCVCLIVSESLSIPDILRKYAVQKSVPIAASKYDEHHLTSILKALIREKIQEIVYLHGVVLEAEGRGILITGASGIGKTTAALRSIKDGYYWIADDITLIRKNKRGELVARGHKRIKDYVHTAATGIIPAVSLLDPGRIKAMTKLAAVIQVERTGIRKWRIRKGEKEILDIKLPCLYLNISPAGYFNENLLQKSMKELMTEWS